MLIPTAQDARQDAGCSAGGSPGNRVDHGRSDADGCDDHSVERAPANSANTAPSFDPARHLAIEPPAWTVSLSDVAGDKPPSPALAAPFRLLSAAGIAAAERASPNSSPIWRGTRPSSTPSAR